MATVAEQPTKLVTKLATITSLTLRAATWYHPASGAAVATPVASATEVATVPGDAFRGRQVAVEALEAIKTQLGLVRLSPVQPLIMARREATEASTVLEEAGPGLVVPVIAP